MKLFEDIFKFISFVLFLVLSFIQYFWLFVSEILVNMNEVVVEGVILMNVLLVM